MVFYIIKKEGRRRKEKGKGRRERDERVESRRERGLGRERP